MLDTISDAAAFELIRQLVASGEYLNALLGTPGMRLEGGGTFRRTQGGLLRRVYTRGSPEYLEARRAGLVEPLPGLMPAPLDAIEEAEVVIGYALPRLLRRLYLELGNGGFGPGYGVLGVRGGHTDTGKTAVDLYRAAHALPPGPWQCLPDSFLPICHWGCAIYSFVDCARADAPVWAWDPNPGPLDERALFRHSPSLSTWLSDWVAGRLYQPALVQDPLTQQWRGATAEEIEQWMADV